MRYIFTLLMISALALFTACQNASSSTAKVKNEKSTETKTTEKSVEKVKTEKKTESHSADDKHDHESDAPRISLADAKKAFDDGEAFFIDTRSAEAFQNEHVKGAVNIRVSELENRFDEIPKDKKVITYCS